MTVVPYNEDAELTIKVGDTEIDNEDSASWETGENTLTVTVKYINQEKTYTVVVTKS